LAKRFNVLSGLSDHTLGATSATIATALGARILEKHFILDKSIGGPDASFSMDEHEFASMVKQIREVERAMGNFDYSLTSKQLKSREHSRSLFVVADIEEGEVFDLNNIKSIRPGNGLHPKYLNQIIGRKAAVSLQRGTPLSMDHIKNL
jgi:pseudaminic acid synthase